ncbi:MAG: zinc-dependent peptidase [Gammaproteobacteria bacterium]|nr:zinc-dependent peptidase [Gammaproteobacteria bacterium]
MEDNESTKWIQRYCWFYEFLSKENQQEFRNLLEVFLKDANFTGVGIEITREIRIAVGGWAVFLVLNRPLAISWYRHIERISIYPGDSLKTGDSLGQMIDGSHYCQIHLAWDEVRESSTKATVSRNTILHEFAHSLDNLDRNIDGHPRLLLSRDEYSRWEDVFCEDYIHNRHDSDRNRLWKFFGLGAWNEFDANDPSCVDVGALFAVSTEMFFECPSQLLDHAPEIYECLNMLYKFDPIKDFPKKPKFSRAWDTILSAKERPRWFRS